MLAALRIKVSRVGQGGFTLLEIAVALALIGITVAAAIDLYSRAQVQRQYDVTYDNMDRIVQALSTYAETADRVPCPADPAANNTLFGWERGVTAVDVTVSANKFPTGVCNSATREGIVPFLTLGLPPETAIDGWGHYFTYAVSPVFARRNDLSYAPNAPLDTQATIKPRDDTGYVHGRCRHVGWVTIENPKSRNSLKARFCCADQAVSATYPAAFNSATDLVIEHTADNTPLSPVRVDNGPYNATGTLNYSSSTLATYITVASGETVPFMNLSAIEAPAFVLVSHGPNGLGAYLANGTAGKFGAPAGKEVENADGDNIFYDGPVNHSAANYYDDIVRWMSQDTVMAAHGALSCQYP